MRYAPDLTAGSTVPDEHKQLPYEVAMYQAKQEYLALLAREKADQSRKSRRSKKGGLIPLNFNATD